MRIRGLLQYRFVVEDYPDVIPNSVIKWQQYHLLDPACPCLPCSILRGEHMHLDWREENESAEDLARQWKGGIRNTAVSKGVPNVICVFRRCLMDISRVREVLDRVPF